MHPTAAIPSPSRSRRERRPRAQDQERDERHWGPRARPPASRGSSNRRARRPARAKPPSPIAASSARPRAVSPRSRLLGALVFLARGEHDAHDDRHQPQRGDRRRPVAGRDPDDHRQRDARRGDRRHDAHRPQCQRAVEAPKARDARQPGADRRPEVLGVIEEGAAPDHGDRRDHHQPAALDEQQDRPGTLIAAAGEPGEEVRQAPGATAAARASATAIARGIVSGRALGEVDGPRRDRQAADCGRQGRGCAGTRCPLTTASVRPGPARLSWRR